MAIRSIDYSLGRSLLVLAATVICMVFASGIAEAQLSTASVTGNVVDTTGAAIPATQIILRESSTGILRTTQTNSSGDYAFVGVAPGAYTLQVTKTGFATVQQPVFALNVNQTAKLNFTLAVGTETQQVTVNSSAVQLQTATANLGTVLTSRAVNSLPLNGRNFSQLLNLTPGASRINTELGPGGNAILTGTFSFPSVNGQMNRSNLFLLDGIIDQQFWMSEYAVEPIIDDIQEFKLQSHNDQSQFGGVLGGIVNVVTKSGTNQFHGDVWEFLRNNFFDARNPLLPKVTPLKQSVYGVTIGGPVIVPYYNGRDRTFFFGAYEGTNIDSANQLLYNVPTAAELNGDFSAISTPLYNPYTTRSDPAHPGQYLRTAFPGNNISSALDPNMVALATEIFPAPITTSSGVNGQDTTPSQTNQNNYTIRIDQQINERNSLWGRLSQFHTAQTASGGFVGLSSKNISDGQNWAVNYLHTFGSSATLQIEGGHVWQFYSSEQALSNPPSTNAFVPGFVCSFLGPLPCQVPVLAITGYAGGGDSYLADDDGNIYELRGDFTKLIGNHVLTIGGDFTRNNESILNANSNLGFSAFQTQNLESTAATGNALASFLVGVPTMAERRNNLKSPQNGWVNGVYAGDQWKVTPKMTVNVGLRYDWVIMPALAANSTQSNISGAYDLRNGTYILTKAATGLGSCAVLQAAPCLPGGTLPANVVISNSNSLINNQLGNIQPRLGLAYQIDDKRVLHLGYARVYDVWSGIMQGVQSEGALWPSFGLDLVSNLNSAGVTASAENPLNFPPGQTHNLPPATPFGQSAYFIAPYLKAPYSDQWMAGIQQQFGLSHVLSLNYVGSRSTHLPCCGFYNTAISPGPGTPMSRAPYTYITPTRYQQSNGSSIYDGLQAQMESRLAHGLAYTFNYTWSKAIDVACDGYFSQEGCFIRNPYNPKADRSVAGFDLRNMFTSTITYELPFGAGRRFASGNRIVDTVVGGWQVNTITTLTSGTPYTVSYSGDVANTGNNNQGINLVGNPVLAHPTRFEWFNTAAFQAPALYTFGNVGRNTLLTQSYKELDLSVFRQFPLPRDARIEFRAEAFNATNTPVWGTPNATLNSTTFGQVLSTASTQRELQFALKIYF